jgi:hypothetical protein
MASTFWFSGAFLFLAVINCWSSIAVARDPGLTRQQKRLQIVLTWLLPFLGAIVTLAVRHFATSQKERSPGDSSLVVEDRHYIGKGYF